ncbi:hypothetical protein BDD12DRAFT_811008 [Trichophaea hybrida]|nr:hypothetical protein BDD12DRAFT_811008 [Trichophaea hybrida]
MGVSPPVSGVNPHRNLSWLRLPICFSSEVFAPLPPEGKGIEAIHPTAEIPRLGCRLYQKGENNESPDVPYAVYVKLFTKYEAPLDKITSNATAAERKQTRLEMKYATLYDDKLPAEDCYNLHGGFERLAAVAASAGQIPSTSKSTTARLKEITQLPEFKTALAKVCAQLKLLPDQANRERTSLHLYSQLSLRVHGNTPQMTLSAEEFCPLEVGALLCFFETQNHWSDPLPFTLLPYEPNELGEQRNRGLVSTTSLGFQKSLLFMCINTEFHKFMHNVVNNTQT